MKFLKELILNNIGLKAISLLLAGLLWFQVAGQMAVQRTLTLPVEFVNMPSNLEISNDYVKTVDVFVRSEISTTPLDQRGMAVVVNLQGATPGAEIIPLTEQNIRSKPSGMVVLSITPPTLRLELEYTLRKIVEVIPSVIGEPGEGYEVTNVEVSPQEVMISGPESRVRDIAQLETEQIDVSGITSTLVRNVYVDLQDPRLRVENTASVQVEVSVQEQRREVRISGVPVSVRPQGTAATLITKSTDVIGSVPLSFEGELSKEGFSATVNVANLEAQQEPYLLLPDVTVPKRYSEVFRVESTRPERIRVRKTR